MPNYGFRCKKGHTFDAVRPLGTDKTKCQSCSGIALKVTAFRSLGINEPIRKLPDRDFREASDMLASRAEEHEKREGVATSTPPLWRMANAYAQQLQKQGATSSKDVRLSR